jgi:membrane protein
MVSLVTSALLAAAHEYMDNAISAATFLWEVLDLAISFGLATVLIALMFKYLPDAEIEWRDTWLGGVVTSILFIAGKSAIGLYLGQASVASSFGAAGSAVVFMIWVYYASLIIMFGAEITHSVAHNRGARVAPSEHAESTHEAART